MIYSSDNIQIIRRVFADNFGKYRNRYFLALFFMAIAAAATGFSAYLIKDVIESVAKSNNFNEVLTVGLLVMVVFIVKGFSSYFSVITLQKIGNSLIARLQTKIFSHMLTLKADYFDQTKIGEIFTTSNVGVTATKSVIELIVTSIGRDILTLCMLIAVMFYQEPLISFLALTVGPVAISMISSAGKKARSHAKKQLHSVSESSSIMKETIHGIMMVKTYTLETEMKRRMEGFIEAIRERNNKMMKLSARMSPVMETLGGISVGAVIIYAGMRASGNAEYLGQLMSFLTSLLLAYEPAKRLAKMHVTMEPLLVNVRFMYQFLDHNRAEEEDLDKKPLTIQNGDIKFNAVNFSYQGKEQILHDISFSVQSGQKAALVGASGSGKSTIFKLLLRLYDPSSGDISIDDQMISQYSLKSLRDQIAYVGQEAHIFTGTIRENIQFGALSASEGEIIKAAKQAHAHDFITQLPNGYDTFVGENGAQLSGGQRQRLAIARAFLRDAPILLLDEATSALDTESEKSIQQALEDIMIGRTTLIIAHRLSTIQKCDCIYVLKNGRIVETGNHDQLIAKQQTYAHLYNLQFAAPAAQ